MLLSSYSDIIINQTEARVKLNIPYKKIYSTVSVFLPSGQRKKIRAFFAELETFSNCSYVVRNSKTVLKRLRKKVKTDKLRVVFYVYDETKWKCQSLYDLLEKDENFEPIILVTKNCCDDTNFNYQTVDDVRKTYCFFEKKKMRIEYAYNCEKEEYIPLKQFSPDLIFYQHPWLVDECQSPFKCSEFALTYYVPYYLPSTSDNQEYALDFHMYVHKYYVFNEILKKEYCKMMKNKGRNLCAAGNPQLDYFYLKKNSSPKQYLIYAPHWSVKHEGTIAYSTFLWSGKVILDYAKKHPELNWIFKPHPLLKSSLLMNNFLTENEVNDYYEEWKKIGKFYDSGDYLDLFDRSYAMITDCGSFMTEFFMTQMPLIRLVSQDAAPFNVFMEKIVPNFYNVRNEEELTVCLEKVIINKNDSMKNQRINALNSLKLKDTYAAKNILEDIKKELKL